MDTTKLDRLTTVQSRGDGAARPAPEVTPSRPAVRSPERGGRIPGPAAGVPVADSLESTGRISRLVALVVMALIGASTLVLLLIGLF